MKLSKINYPGWELKFFDKAKNFREYQLSFLTKHIKGNLCEVGPGNAVLCNLYQNLCNKIELYEPTKKIYIKIKKKFRKNPKIKVYNKLFKSNNKFDTILYLDVLEHIKHPIKDIKFAYKKLKKRGKIIINLPAFQHLFSQFDKDVGHYKRYSRGTFLKEIKGLKYNKISFYYIDSIGYFLSLLSKFSSNNYKQNFGFKILVWDFLISVSKIIDKLLFYKLGKSLIVIIEK